MKRILTIATGGTVASSDTGSGLAPALTGEELLARIPGVGDSCAVDVVQPLAVDSTNMRPEDWLAIAAEVERGYDAYDGFVVLHGTDTLAYSASALSYLVQGSAKPIVFTGSQLPLERPGTDAPRNVSDAFAVACDEDAHDVLVVFAGAVIAGTRARKQRTRSLEAFVSANVPALGHVSAGKATWEGEVVAGAPGGSDDVRFFHALDTRVQALKLTPGMDARTVEALRPVCDALVVESFGIGGVPEYGGIADSLLAWADSGRLLVMTTQVPEEGCDMGAYAVGRAFSGNGRVVAGGDATPESLLAKAMWALGQADDIARVRELMRTPVNHDRSC